MSKELEALEVRKQELINRLNTDFEDDIYGTHRQLLQLKIENINLQIQIYNLMQPAIQKKLLEPMAPIYMSKETPPTAEQLCEELGEYIGEEVKFDNVKLFFYYEKYTEKNLFYYVYITLIRDGEKLYFATFLPPRLIKRIAQFYEAEVK